MTRNAGKPLFQSASVFFVLVLCACASLPDRAVPQAACEQAFLASDARIRAADMVDAGASRIKGFPYLRSNRFLASYASHELSNSALSAWWERMRQLDMQVRHIELQNTYENAKTAQIEVDRLDACGRQLLAADLSSPKLIDLLRQRAQAPDLYADSARILGAYPLAVPFMKLGIARLRARTLDAFMQTKATRRTDSALVEYAPSPAKTRLGETQIAGWLHAARHANTLGIPELLPRQLQMLAAHYAPTWQVQTQGAYDLLGVPMRTVNGLNLDTNAPVTYTDASFTRFDGQVLLQLSYTVWFSSRPANSSFDPFAGALDGLVWRVTLDTDGQPLLYDSIHPCGCYHLFFPTQRLRKRGESGFWQEAITVPATPTVDQNIVLRVASRTHFLTAISTPRLNQPGSVQREYALEEYTGLRLQRPLRLFDQSGFIPGTQRPERWFLWPSGVPNAGAMRQSGRQVTAFVGKRYFNDPDLVGRYFERAVSSP